MSAGVIADSYVSASYANFAAFIAAKSPAVALFHNEASGLTMVDGSGNGRDGAYKSGSVTLGVGGVQVGDNAVTIAAVTQGTTAYGGVVTDASWMNLTSACTFISVQKSTTAAGFLLTRWDAATAGNQLAALDISANKTRFYGNVAGTTVIATGATTVTDGAYHIQIGVFDGSQLKVNVDGVADGSATPAGTGPFSLNTPTTGRGLMVGGRYAASGNSQSAKTIDFSAVLSVALSDADCLVAAQLLGLHA